MQQRIKILQFPIANSKGGITQYALQNWKFIDKTRFQFDFATMSTSLDFADKLERDGCQIHYISCYAEENKERFIDEFTRILTGGNYDIVHLHTRQWKSFLVEQIAKKAGVRKIIIHAHSTGISVLDEKKRKVEMQLHDSVLKQLTEDIGTDFWACSWKAVEFIFGNKIPRQKIEIMKNAIDLSKYTYNREIRNEYRKMLKINDGDFVIGNVGRLAYEKNQEFLIEVLSEINKSNVAEKNKYKLLLVGSGEREQEYKRIVCERGLEDRVIFTGHRKDVSELLQAMDMFCLPSWFEGLPISLIEAQASGLPCILNDNITDEASINNNVIQLPLDTGTWKKTIMESRTGQHCRESNNEKLIAAGYNITDQIKYLEQKYLE